MIEIFQELPSEIKPSLFKEIFGIITHTMSVGYVDPFGVITGTMKNDAYLTRYCVTNPLFLKYFKNTVLDFNAMYTIFKCAKKDIRVEYDKMYRITSFIIADTPESLYRSIITYVDDNPDVETTYAKYDNPHIFKQTHAYELDVEDFGNHIADDYVCRYGHHVITREAVPKPKKLISGWYSVSDIVQQDEESYIYYTTHLQYPNNVSMDIASVVLNLE